MTKSSTTPIVMLTLQDLRDVIREEMGSSVNVTHESETPSASKHVPAKLAGKEVVFGLDGICKIFNCKMSRAQKLKNTIISLPMSKRHMNYSRPIPRKGGKDDPRGQWTGLSGRYLSGEHSEDYRHHA